MDKYRISPPSEELAPLLKRLPDAPGVYLMKGHRGDILYVGKAGNLKKRVSTYFSPGAAHTVKTRIMVNHIQRFETIITASETEALILESTLIKKYRPRYNVILKDDKRYPSLRMDLSHPYPRLSIVRKIKKDKSRYFGPFSSAGSVRQTLRFVKRTFTLRECKDREFAQRTRPCINFQMGICLAPCCREVKREVYDSVVKEVVLFLNGRTPELVKAFRQRMEDAAVKQDFEKAAEIRDKMFALQRTLEKQVAVTAGFMDRDVVAVARSNEYNNAVAVIMTVRQGFLQGSRTYPFSGPFSGSLAEEEEIIGEFIQQYYTGMYLIPKEILLSHMPEDGMLLESRLTDIRGKKVKLIRPARGEKRKILEMARVNAAKALADAIDLQESRRDLLVRLQRRLRLKHSIQRIECFDISNLSGSNPVAGMVTFVHGNSHRESYRRYAIRSVTKPDDYAAMQEVLSRRFRNKKTEERLPDLVMIDGGKGQLNIAVSVITELFPEGGPAVIAIAKKNKEREEVQDRIFLPKRSNPVNFGTETDLLLFLQKIRDEAHRFAISYHRGKRNKSFTHSVMDSVSGVGPKRKRELLMTFGSVEGVAKASIAELSRIPGITAAVARDLKKKCASIKVRPVK